MLIRFLQSDSTKWINDEVAQYHMMEHFFIIRTGLKIMHTWQLFSFFSYPFSEDSKMGTEYGINR